MLTTFSPQSVTAGSNGQQLKVDICYAKSFTVSGTNQNPPPNNKASKTVTADTTKCATYSIEKWWWVDEITIVATFADGTIETQKWKVPKTSSSDWYTATFRRNAAVEKGYRWVYLDPYYDMNTYLNVEQSTKNNLVTTKDSRKSGYYRMDCSGFVSYAWGITVTPSPDTKSLHYNYSKQIRIDELSAGDAVNNPITGENGHIILFVKWIDKSKYIFIGYDQFKWVRSDGTLVDQDARYQMYQFSNVNGSQGNLSYYNSDGSTSSTGNYIWYADRKK